MMARPGSSGDVQGKYSACACGRRALFRVPFARFSTSYGGSTTLVMAQPNRTGTDQERRQTTSYRTFAAPSASTRSLREGDVSNRPIVLKNSNFRVDHNLEDRWRLR
jgi:hypothetical protein